MKQLFDWLREQMNENAFPTHENYSAIWHDDVMQVVNEAEAKWESDKAVLENYRKEIWEQQLREYGQNTAESKWKSECCEYEYHVAPSKDIYFLTRCNHRHNGRLSGDRPYCGFCGKPIKILEVE